MSTQFPHKYERNSYKDKGIYPRQRLGILKNSTASIFPHMEWRETHDTSCHGNEKVPEPKFQLDPTSKNLVQQSARETKIPNARNKQLHGGKPIAKPDEHIVD